ncbi:MAG: AAA family ATPase [Acidobacteria bacterium]|nr:AAA family ATPase [Acidobacteriota bacterium]
MVFELVDYKLEKFIAKINKFSLWSGQSKNNNPVLVKLITQDASINLYKSQLKHEYEILKSLDFIDKIPRALAFEQSQEGVAIILENNDVLPLSIYLQNHKLAISDTLNIIIKALDILTLLHQQKILHKNINLDNILVSNNPSNLSISLMGFDISSKLSTEYQVFVTPNVLEGSLEYISPEQTGRMNTFIDYRADFYSLGVVFYQLLTGQLPFLSKDPIELVHSHIAKQPIFPSEINLDIPKTISNIVMKLLEKNAAERYQSSFGLKSDLERCLRELNENNINEFSLGKEDISEHLQIPKKLYGREKEIELLINTFGNIRNNSEITLVSGYSGIGKSSLIQEIYKPITQKKGYFISGKYDQFQRNIPYSAIIKAFTNLVKQILTESVEKILLWKKEILDVLGTNAQIIIDVIPELALIIGTQEPVSKLQGSQAQIRFNLVFQNFVRVLAKENSPLVLFIDDLQWADISSINLLEKLITDYEIKYLFIIGAYRDNEVDESHPLINMLNKAKEIRGQINQIILSPLTLENVEGLIIDTFKNNLISNQELAEICHQKTAGNPFFLEQFIKRLFDIKLIFFDRNIGKWSWDINKIKQADITSNVVDLMLAKIKSLSKSSQKILKLAACIGNQFDLKTVSVISKKDIATTFSSLWQLLQEGLILPVSENYKFLDSVDSSQVVYRFLHDRVQQAAYSLIDNSEKELAHLKIGRLILSNTTEKDKEEKIFDIVNQINFGSNLISEIEEKINLIKLNLFAGEKAKESIAYDSAFRYLSTAIKILPSNAWQNHYQLTLSLYLEISEAAYLNSDFEQMENFIQSAIDNANNLLDKIKAYEIKINSLVAQLKPLEAIKISLMVLKLLEINLPEKPSKASVLINLLKTKWLLKGKSKEDLTSLPVMQDPYRLAVMRILYVINSSAFFASPNLFILSVFTRLNLSVKYGNTNESAHAYAAYGLILCGVLQQIESGNEFGEIALNILDKFKTKQKGSDTFFAVYSFVKTWKNHFQEMLDPLFESYQNGLQTGNVEYSIYSIQSYLAFLIISGKELSFVKSETTKYIKVTDKLRHKMGNYLVRMYDQIVSNLSDEDIDFTKAANLVGQSYNENFVLPMYLTANDRTSLGILYFNKLFLSYLFQDYKQAISNLNTLRNYLDGVIGTYISAYFYFYDSLVWLATYDTFSAFEKTQIYYKVVSNQKKIKKWMQHAPMNFSNKYFLVEAEKARISKNNQLAASFYEKAIELSKEHNYIQEEALANELAGKFYLKQKRIAKIYFLEAHRCYIKWGAITKASQIEKEYPEIIEQSNKINFLNNSKTSTLLLDAKNTSLDLATVIKASQAISSEIVLDKLMTELLKIVVENAGANRGFLLLKKDSKFFVEVQSHSDKPAIKLSQPILLEECKYLSQAIINYVIRTKENLVLDNASKDDRFIQDPYIKGARPKSILSIPIINQGNLTGILYLENNLSTGVFTVERLEVLHILLTQAAISIENANLYDDLNKALEHEKITKKVQAELLAVQKELAYARQLQLSMLPKENLLLDKVEIVGQMRTATEVGGDYYDFIKIDDSHYCLAIGDATGHGVGAGLVVGMIKSLLVNSLLNLKLDSKKTDEKSEKNEKPITLEIMKNLNISLKSSLAYRSMGMALTIAILDLEEMLIEISSAAMPPIVFYHADKKITETINLAAPPLGFVKKINLKSTTLSLKPGDKLVFVSDGFPERMNSENKMWGYETVVKTLSQICQENQNSELILQKLFKDCDDFAQDIETKDDMTGLAFCVH